MNTQRPKILATRAFFPDIFQRLADSAEVMGNQDDAVWTREQFIDRLRGVDGVLTVSFERIDEEVLRACPNLKICANVAVGFDNFDLPAMTAHGVTATNTPGVLTESTADYGFALVMAAARRVTEAERWLRSGQWKRSLNTAFLGNDLHGATLGIIGMGRIGQAVARRGALGFDMRVLYHNRSRLSPEQEQQCRAQYVSKDDLLRQADHVILVVPLTAETRHLIGAKELALMKPTATLTNIARGGVVDDAALAAALKAGRIAAAALDVYEGEPVVNPALLECESIVLSPHIASATTRTRRTMFNLAVDNLLGYFRDGKALTPLNSPAAG